MGHKCLLDLSQKSENPWRDLFLWAVLQGHHDMATYFWAMVSSGQQPRSAEPGLPGIAEQLGAGASPGAGGRAAS